MAIAAIASPVRSLYPSGQRNSSPCLALGDAATIVGRYIAFLEHRSSDLGDANATAQILLDDGYQEISDSILSLKGDSVSSTPPRFRYLLFPSRH